MSAFKHPRDTWNARYQGAQGMLFGEAPNGWLAMQRSRLTPGRRVLCPADGDGRNGVWLAALGAHVTAFDLADVGVDRARAFALQQGFTERAASACAASAAIGQRAVLDAPLGGSLTICCADISDWPWRAASVDMIAGIFFQFADPALRASIFRGFQESLVPGGLLVVEGYGMRQLQFNTGGPGVADNLYTLELLREAFNGWAVLASRDCDAVLSEGAAHVGPSHLISVVLQKPV